MITVIHGDDIVRSREYFFLEKEGAKNPVFFDKEILMTDLVQVIEGGSLFSDFKNIFIENFFSGRKANSSDSKQIIEYVNKNDANVNFVFWEGKILEKSVLTALKNATQKTFNLPQSLFSFLDGIKPNNINNLELFHAALINSNEDIIFYMIIRQMRLLLAVSNLTSDCIDEVKRLAPWQKSKLEKQASLFSKDELTKNYNNLFEIDLKQKSGRLGKTLVQSIDIFLTAI
jgi:hypothetical protein